MTVEECDSAPFAKDEYYFKLKPIVRWEDKGFVSNVVESPRRAPGSGRTGNGW